MALTFPSAFKPENFGSQNGAVGTLQLDASYPTGGYSLTPQMFGLSVINSLSCTTVQGDLLFYNYTTKKLMAFTAGGGAGGVTGSTSGAVTTPTISLGALPGHQHVIQETINEAVAVAANVGALASVPTIVQNVYVTAGGVTGPFVIIPSTQTPATGQVQISHTTNLITFFAGDAVTAADVTYIVGAVTSVSGGMPIVIGVSPQTFAAHTHTVAAGAGGLSEVAGGTDLSTVIGNYIVIGQ